MFVSRKYHERALSEIQAKLDDATLQLMYKELYNKKTVALLESQIEDLRRMVFPTNSTTISRESMEVDSVLSASEKLPEMSEEERNSILDGNRELDLLISGNYDTDLYN